MFVLNVRNVHEALPEALLMLKGQGEVRETRYGKVLEFPGPVTTVYRQPCERVMFHPTRDANPFFHLFEALWMLGGRNDVAYVSQFAKKISSFSDDGETFRGAYGHRWKKWFGFDQLNEIIKNLKKNRDCRRQVLQMWDAKTDLLEQEGKKDLPCNDVATFQIGSDGRLNMCVFCRSNDIVWGCYGANAVHFSVLLEYMASCIDVKVGRYEQISINWHGYVSTLEPIADLVDVAAEPYNREKQMLTPYDGESGIKPYKLMRVPKDTWDQDLHMFLDEGNNALGYRDPFFRNVALPMLDAHETFKSVPQSCERYTRTLKCIEYIAADDWRRACLEWVLRRQSKFLMASDNGVAYE